MTIRMYSRKPPISTIVVLSTLCFTCPVTSLNASEPIALDNLNKSLDEFVSRGNYKDALPSAQSSVAIARDLKDRDALASSLARLANIYLHLGRFGDAEPLYKEALRIREEAVPSDPQAVANSLNDMGQLYYTLQRYPDAADLYRKALSLWEHVLPPDAAQIGEALNNLGATYRSLGRNEEAEPLLLRALAIQKTALGENHPYVAQTLNNIGTVYLLQNRLAEAEPFVRQSLEMYERLLPANHPKIADALNILGVLYFRKKSYVEAAALFARAGDIGEKSLGLQHPDTLQYLGRLAQVREAQSNLSEAYDLYRKVASNYIARSDRAGGAIAMADAREDSGGNSAQQRVYLALVRVAHALTNVERRRGAGLVDEAFVIGQRAETSAAAAALSQMAVRFGAGTGRLVDLVRRRQELVAEYQALDRKLVAAYSAPDASRDLAQESQWQKQRADIDGQIGAVDAQLAREFPKYPALANPKPLSIADTQKLLSPNEALLHLTFENKDVHQNDGQYAYVWVVTKGDFKFDKLSLPKTKAAEMVQTLRCGLDFTQWDGVESATRCNGLVGASPHREAVTMGGKEESIDVLPFDLAKAHELHQALLRSLADVIKDKRLIVVPSGPLTSLPFNVLVAEPPKMAIPETLAEYRDVAWLGARTAITVLPSVASLKALRQFAKASRATKPYLGIGDPLLDGAQNDPVWGADNKARAELARTKRCAHTPSSLQIASTRGARSVRSFTAMFRGTNADIEQIRYQPPLPETADELCEVARRLGVPDSEILLGADATETRLKDLSEQGRLADYSIVHFATHGALSGQVEGSAEPGLILTPPPKGTNDAKELERDDGFLTASEIATLKLDADWVILSACNTAGAQGQGAEALSGMARAFFYAGARALLVSHWAVGSDAAVKLTTRAFGELKAHPEIGRAEAFKISMQELTKKGDLSDAHPSQWAPFVVVGEGAASK
jgi:CHAT domain-containing protein/tetratricopeptide (TPR) repeat protein